MIIYRAFNTKNLKSYIGQTTTTLSNRISGHYTPSELNQNIYFHNALRKYPREIWRWTEIYWTDNLDELNLAEDYFIRLFDSMNRDKGYNLTSGGRNYVRSPESIEKHRQIMIGKKRNKKFKDICRKRMLGTKASEETKLKHSLSSKYLYTFINPNGIIFENINNVQLFCNNYNLNKESINRYFELHRNVYKGWKLSRSSIKKIIQEAVAA